MKRKRHTPQQVVRKLQETRRLALLEEENARLKKLVSDLSLDKQNLTEALDVAKNL